MTATTQTLIDLGYIAASILFILGIKMLGKQERARMGNLMSALGMLIAVTAACGNENSGRLSIANRNEHCQKQKRSLNQNQWQPAVDDYARVVTDQTTDKDLLAHQASALANVLLADADETATQIKDPWTRLAVAYALHGQDDLAIEAFGRALSQMNSAVVKQTAFEQAAKFDELLLQLAQDLLEDYLAERPE